MERKLTAFIFPALFTCMFVILYWSYKQNKVADEDLTKRPGYQEFDRIDHAFVNDQTLMGNNHQSTSIAADLQKFVIDTIQADPFWEDLDLGAAHIYCHLDGDYLMVLSYIPGILNYNEGEQKKLIDKLWPKIQEQAKTIYKGYPTIGLGLRDESKYGLISIGGLTNPANHNAPAIPWFQQNGGEEIFYPYFISETLHQQAINDRQPDIDPLKSVH